MMSSRIAFCCSILGIIINGTSVADDTGRPNPTAMKEELQEARHMPPEVLRKKELHEAFEIVKAYLRQPKNAARIEWETYRRHALEHKRAMERGRIKHDPLLVANPQATLPRASFVMPRVNHANLKIGDQFKDLWQIRYFVRDESHHRYLILSGKVVVENGRLIGSAHGFVADKTGDKGREIKHWSKTTMRTPQHSICYHYICAVRILYGDPVILDVAKQIIDVR